MFRSELRLEPIRGSHDVLTYSFLMQTCIDRQHILEKLGLSSRAQIATWVATRGLVGDGELVGLVTDRDLSRSALGAVEQLPLSVERDILRRRRIRNIMATEPDSIEPDATLREAAEILLENKVGCLPVVEGLHLVGIITEADFVRDFLERS